MENANVAEETAPVKKEKKSKSLDVQHSDWFKERFPDIERIHRNTDGKTGDINTVVILDDGTKGISTLKKNSDQSDNNDLGVLWAYTKAKETQATEPSGININVNIITDEDEDKDLDEVLAALSGLVGGRVVPICGQGTDTIMDAIRSLSGGTINTLEEAMEIERSLYSRLFG